MKKTKILQTFLVLFVSLPMWFFLLYSILSRLDVDRLVWFIYWAYIPVSIVNGIIAGILGDEE